MATVPARSAPAIPTTMGEAPLGICIGLRIHVGMSAFMLLAAEIIPFL